MASNPPLLIEAMSNKQLRELISKAGLPTSDLFEKKDLRARAHEAAARLNEAEKLRAAAAADRDSDDAPAAPKRRRKIEIGTDSDDNWAGDKAVCRVPPPSKKSGESAFSQSVLESLNCPITAALPVVPVLAEDGRIYERAAIKRWLSKKAKSPLTNLPMGKHLADASGTTRPLVLSAIENGVVDADSAAAWHLGSAKAKIAGDLPGGLSSAKADFDRAGAFASTPEIELLRRAAAVKLETESLAKETESLLNEGEAAGVDDIATILGAAEEPGAFAFDCGGHWERRIGSDIERAKKFLRRARSSYTRAAEKGHQGGIKALYRLDAIAALARLE